MQPQTRAPFLEAQFIRAGFKGKLAVHVSRAPLLDPVWQHLVPVLAATASPKRLAEFASGRELAHRCLATLGFEPQAVGRGRDREPLWPNGACGSITHTDGFTAAVAGTGLTPAPASLGLDVEPVARLDEAACEEVLTPRERTLVSSSPAHVRARLETGLFSAKEAIFKAQFPLTGVFVDFGEVQLQPDSTNAMGNAGTLRVSHDLPQLQDATVTVFYCLFDTFMFTGCVIAQRR